MTKKIVSKKTETTPVKIETEIVETTPVETTPVETTTSVEGVVVQETSVDQGLVEMKNCISLLKTQMKEIEQTLKLLTVQYKQESKRKRKRRTVGENGIKKGEFKAVKLSPQLASFLGVSTEDTMKRDQVSKMIYTYIKDNNLYFEDKPKTIMKVDAKLQKLFGKLDYHINSNNPDLGTGLSIYNMQKYLQQHFISV